MAMKPRSRRGRSPIQRGWTVPTSSPTTDPRRRYPRPSGPTPLIEPSSRIVPESESRAESSRSTLETILDDFNGSWERGEQPRAERYLGLLSPDESAELIYHEFCLAEAADLRPDPVEYHRRFPDHERSLGRLFALHGVFSSSELQAWAEPVDLPSSGDEIGPYRLLRELGRGAFARVFLAEQSDLDHRLVVLKVSTRSTAEPQLLARARHAHIVEVLRHATAEDGALHLVCMPFLGGATLASVLDERRRRRLRPRSGLDLLSDLDRVSAPEYPSTELARPAREIVAGLSYAQALAWIVAGLAEALDHAYHRGVAHGDLKPSNILLTAEASPLLLDFNLSIDWRDAGPGDPAEIGGTLAYMAPERLKAIAEGNRDWTRKAADLHRADLYSLGLLLLEALTGQTPEIPSQRTGTPRNLAAELAGLRRKLPASLGSGGEHSIPPALRSILSKCLAPDPLDRYARGNDLAEDLGRWRSDRPLVFAEEPRSSGLTRKVRRRRAALITLGLTMSAAVVVTFLASIVLRGTQRDQALAKYATITDRHDSGAFGIRNAAQWRAGDNGEPIELASRQLTRYGVLNDPEWRTRDDIRSLPDRERGELEVWLFEQILRYAVALSEAPNSPESWKRGLALLDRTLDQVSSEPLQAQRLLLLDRLNQPDRSPNRPRASRLPRWMDTYLAGVAAEPLHARAALGHYLEALKDRPDLYWGHYRTVVVACRINEFDEAIRHLRICSARSPANPIHHAQLASLLLLASRDMPKRFNHDPIAEALLESDRALRLDPDYATAYEIRAKILKATGQANSVEADLERYSALSTRAGQARVLALRGNLMIPGFSGYRPNPETRDALERMNRQVLEVNPNDLEFRTKLAANLATVGRYREAIVEYDRVLEDDPEFLRARYGRALALFRVDRAAAIEEYHWLIDHPRFEELLCEAPIAIHSYYQVANDLVERGRTAEALEVAQRCLVHINRSQVLTRETLDGRKQYDTLPKLAPKTEIYYLIATLHEAASKTARIAPEDRLSHFAETVKFLKLAFAESPTLRKSGFATDKRFDASRVEICRHLDDPHAGHPSKAP